MCFFLHFLLGSSETLSLQCEFFAGRRRVRKFPKKIYQTLLLLAMHTRLRRCSDEDGRELYVWMKMFMNSWEKERVVSCEGRKWEMVGSSEKQKQHIYIYIKCMRTTTSSVVCWFFERNCIWCSREKLNVFFFCVFWYFAGVKWSEWTIEKYSIDEASTYSTWCDL